jgi:thiamine-monophosphate kinase
MRFDEAAAVATIRRAAAACGMTVEADDDDAHVLPLSSRLTCTDVLVEGVDFRRGMYPLRYVGHRAFVQNASDLYACGAEPVGLLWSLCVPPWCELHHLEALTRGMAHAAAPLGVALLGGDLSSTDGPLTVAITMVGALPGRSTHVRRRGARVGDDVWLSKPVGGAARGLELLLQRLAHDDVDSEAEFARWLSTHNQANAHAIRAHLQPLIAPLPHALHVTSCIDISDGLARDAHRLASASQVTLRFAGDSEAWLADVAGGATLRHAWSGGEDYALLWTQPPGAPAAPLPAMCVGRVEALGAVAVWCGERAVPDEGHDHGGDNGSGNHDGPALPAAHPDPTTTK